MDLTMTNRPHLVLGVGHLDRPGVHQLRSQVLHLPRETMLWRQQLAGCWRFMVEILFMFMITMRRQPEPVTKGGEGFHFVVSCERLRWKLFVFLFPMKIINLYFFRLRWKFNYSENYFLQANKYLCLTDWGGYLRWTHQDMMRQDL